MRKKSYPGCHTKRTDQKYQNNSFKDNKWQRKRRIQCQVFSVLLVVAFLILLGLHLRSEEDEENVISQKSPTVFHNILTQYIPKDPCTCKPFGASCEGINSDAGSYISQFLSEQCSGATDLYVGNSAFLEGTLQAGWLWGLNHSLIRLEINNCNLKQIQEGSFDSAIFEHLHILVFQNFPVKELKNGTFKGLREITHLQINDNLHFKYVEPGLLEPMKQILTLTIENSVEEGVLANFTKSASSSIQTVSMKANILPYVKPNVFSILKGLQRLYASGSRIRDIHPEALKPLSQLEVLDLSVNQINYLSLGLFDNTKGLVNLFLKNNLLKTLPEGLFDKISGKLSLQLQNNPWNCTCELAWLQRLVYNKQIDILDAPKCSHPKEEADKLLMDVDFSYCYETTTGVSDGTTTLSTTSEYTTETKTSTSASTTESNTETSDQWSSDTTDGTTTDPLSTTSDYTTDAQTSTSASTTESNTETSDQWSSDTTTHSTISSEPAATTTITNEITSSTSTTFSTETSSTITTSTMFTTTSETTTTPYFSNISCNCDEEPCDETSMTIAIGEVCINCNKPHRRRLLSMSFQITNVFMVSQRDTKLEVGVISVDGTSLLLIERASENVTCHYRILKEAKISTCDYRYCATFDVKPDTAYTVCLVPKNMNVSPLDCQAYTTLPLKEDQAWLLRREMPLVLTICTVTLISVAILGAIISYFLVQRHPSLIKGNKRVVIVGHHAADIMVMPKEYSLHRESEPTRRQSDISCETTGTSSTSYVDPNEPTPVQLIAWRFNRMWDRLKLSENLNASSTPSQPPPLPPHPKEKHISSISWDLNTAQESNNYTTVLPH